VWLLNGKRECMAAHERRERVWLLKRSEGVWLLSGRREGVWLLMRDGGCGSSKKQRGVAAQWEKRGYLAAHER
jgi:hypothetical protein